MVYIESKKFPFIVVEGKGNPVRYEGPGLADIDNLDLLQGITDDLDQKCQLIKDLARYHPVHRCTCVQTRHGGFMDRRSYCTKWKSLEDSKIMNRIATFNRIEGGVEVKFKKVRHAIDARTVTRIFIEQEVNPEFDE